MPPPGEKASAQVVGLRGTAYGSSCEPSNAPPHAAVGRQAAARGTGGRCRSSVSSAGGMSRAMASTTEPSRVSGSLGLGDKPERV